MQDKITLAIDALASAAFIEGGVSADNTQAARDLTEQRKRELLEAIGTPCLHQIAEPAAYPELPELGIDTAGHTGARIRGYTADQMRAYVDADRAQRTAPQAAQAAQAAVPEGYVMVPAMPTAEMASAYRSEGCAVLSMPGWRAMLSAAPAHPAEGVPADVSGALDRMDALLQQGLGMLAVGDDSATAQAAAPVQDEEIYTATKEEYRRMFGAACRDLGLISEALDLDLDDGGAEPILEAIEELKALAARAAHPEEGVPAQVREALEEARDALVDVVKGIQLPRAAMQFRKEVQALASVRTALATTPAAAAPVVLPELLSDEQIDAVFNQMPDGAQGFLKSWGYRQFARALLAGVSAPAAGAAQAVEPFGYVNTYTGQFFNDVEQSRKGNEGHWRTVYVAPRLTEMDQLRESKVIVVIDAQPVFHEGKAYHPIKPAVVDSLVTDMQQAWPDDDLSGIYVQE